MQSDRYFDYRTAAGTCTWCKSEYLVSASRANDTQVFCCRKCETEARFWLYELLKPQAEA